MSLPVPLKTTIGCEFECVLALNTHPDADIDYYKGYGADVVRNVLSEPLLAECATCGKLHEFHLPLRAHNIHEEDTSRWAVEVDNTAVATSCERKVVADAKDFVKFFSVEFKSRILRPSCNLKTTHDPENPDHEHEITYQQEIIAVLNKLKSNCRTFDTSSSAPQTLLWLFTNEKCGFHVHVGNENLGFPLQTVKNAAIIATSCERQMDALLTLDRIGGTILNIEPFMPRLSFTDRKMLKHTPFNDSPSTAFIVRQYSRRQREALAGGDASHYSYRDDVTAPEHYPQSAFDSDEIWEAAHGNDIQSWITLITGAPSLHAVQNLGFHGHGTTLNFGNLVPSRTVPRTGYSARNTVEFRQHTGTLNADEAIACIDFVVQMMQYAHSQTSPDMADIVQREFFDPDFTAMDLLTLFGCSEQSVRQYSNQMDADHFWYNGRFQSEALDAQNAIERKDVMGSVAQQVSLQDSARYNPNLIADRIGKKLFAGAYGQFKQEDLDILLAKARDAVYGVEDDLADVGKPLTIGFVSDTVEGPRAKSHNMYTFDCNDDWKTWR